MKEYQVTISRTYTTNITLKFPDDGRKHMDIIDEDTILLGEQTFPDKFGRDKTYTLYYYQWQPSKNQIKLEL